MAKDKKIYKIEDGSYYIFGNTWGNGQFGLIYSDDETQVRITSTQNVVNPIYWETITEIEDNVGGFYTDKADLEARGLPGFTEIPGGGGVTSDNVSNESSVEGATVTEALDNLNTNLAINATYENKLSISSNIPFFLFAIPIFSVAVDEDGAYQAMLSAYFMMSNTNRSFVSEWRINGAAVAGTRMSIEVKDSTNIQPMQLNRLFTGLASGDEISIVFGPESFGSTATITEGSQLLIDKKELS